MPNYAVSPQFGIQEMSYAIHYNTDADLGTYILVSTLAARLRTASNHLCRTLT